MNEKNTIRTPEFLKKGSTIAVAAPSFGATTEPYITRFNQAIQNFTEAGYTVIPGKCCFKDDGIGMSTNPQTAARELEHFYTNPAIDAIISCGGGECMCETVAHIDFEKLKDYPAKWFMGYSDNTNFIFPLVTITGSKAIYGPCFPTFGRKAHKSEEDALSLLEGKIHSVSGYEKFQSPQADSQNTDPLGSYILDREKILTSFICQEGKAQKLEQNQEIQMEGTLLGGCLDVLANLTGTKLDNMKAFNASSQGIIWILEACDSNVFDLRRQLWHLDQCGWFEKAKGFVFGRPLAAFEQSFGLLDQYKAATDILAKYNVPIIMDADIGHIDPDMPIIMGAQGKVTAKGNSITVEF